MDESKELEIMCLAILRYFEKHEMDSEGQYLYLKAEKILGNITVIPNI